MVSSTRSKSELGTTTLPSAYGTTGPAESKRLAGQLEKMLASSPTSTFTDPLTEALLNPSYAPSTASEEALLGQTIAQTQGMSATRGLGPATQGGLAQALTPALSGLRQQNVGNLQEAQIADLTQQLSQRGIDTAALNELIGYAMPTTVAGTRSTSKSGPGSGSSKDPSTGMNRFAGRILE